MVKTRISSKGQTTIPAKFRARWKSVELVWEELPDGGARVSPVPDILSLFGSAGAKPHRDPNEKAKARAAWADSSEKGKAKK